MCSWIVIYNVTQLCTAVYLEICGFVEHYVTCVTWRIHMTWLNDVWRDSTHHSLASRDLWVRGSLRQTCDVTHTYDMAQWCVKWLNTAQPWISKSVSSWVVTSNVWYDSYICHRSMVRGALLQMCDVVGLHQKFDIYHSFLWHSSQHLIIHRDPWVRRSLHQMWLIHLWVRGSLHISRDPWVRGSWRQMGNVTHSSMSSWIVTSNVWHIWFMT